MLETLRLILGLLASPSEIEAFRSTAPAYLSSDGKSERHLVAARIAATESGVPEEIILSIAWFESRYDPTAVTAEPLSKKSCGVMTPVPRRSGCHPPSLIEGYREGAGHYRMWRDSWRCRGSDRCAMLGYAGGGALIAACKRGPYVVERAHGPIDLCTYVPESRLGRARLIRRRVEAASGS